MALANSTQRYPLLKAYFIRLALSVLLVNAATAPYILYGHAVRSAAGAPWLWAFLIDEFGERSLLPTSPGILFFATAALLALAALTRPTSIIITGWCVVNSIAAFLMNFHLYRA